jgi:hypothetical protein
MNTPLNPFILELAITIQLALALAAQKKTGNKPAPIKGRVWPWLQ